MTVEAPDQPAVARGALTPRALAIGTALLFGAVLWVRHSELLVHTINLTESTPPVPAIAALLLLVVLRPLLARLGRWLSLTRRELVLIYFFVAIGAMMPSLGVLRMVIPCATVPFYFATAENNYEVLQPHIPAWLRPTDPEAIRTLWEGTEGPVPWAQWLGPIGHWTLFITLLWATALCLTVLVRRPWVEDERLAFPLLYLPMDMTEGSAAAQADHPTFFRDPLMWIGFGLAVAFNVANIVNSLNPGVRSTSASCSLSAHGAPCSPWPLTTVRRSSAWATWSRSRSPSRSGSSRSPSAWRTSSRWVSGRTSPASPSRKSRARAPTC